MYIYPISTPFLSFVLSLFLSFSDSDCHSQQLTSCPNRKKLRNSTASNDLPLQSMPTPSPLLSSSSYPTHPPLPSVLFPDPLLLPPSYTPNNQPHPIPSQIEESPLHDPDTSFSQPFHAHAGTGAGVPSCSSDGMARRCHFLVSGSGGFLYLKDKTWSPRFVGVGRGGRGVEHPEFFWVGKGRGGRGFLFSFLAFFLLSLPPSFPPFLLDMTKHMYVLFLFFIFFSFFLLSWLKEEMRQRVRGTWTSHFTARPTT